MASDAPTVSEAPAAYQGWLLLSDGTYLDASEVVAVQPSGDGVTLYTAAMSFLTTGTTVEAVMDVVAKHRKGGPPSVAPGQQKKKP